MRRLESKTETTLLVPETPKKKNGENESKKIYNQQALPPAKAASGIGTLVSARLTTAFASPWLFLAWHSYDPKSSLTREAILRVERVVVGPLVKWATE